MSEWNAGRIAELRRLAERLREAEKAVSKESGMLASRGGWSAPLDDAISDEDAARHALIISLKGGALLSLLDELESVTRERDEARLRTADLENECSDLAKALYSCCDGR